MENVSENMNKQVVKYNKWFSKHNHEVFVQCMLKEPHIECKMSIPFPENKAKFKYQDEITVFSICILVILVVVLCLRRK